MALSETSTFTSPIKLGSTNVAILWGTGEPDGDASPEVDALKGSIYIRTDNTSNQCPLRVKVAEAGSDDDWVELLADSETADRVWSSNLTLGTDKKIYFRDTGLYVYSPADGELRIVGDTKVTIGDGTNQVEITSAGVLSLAGTAKRYREIPLFLMTGGGTADITVWNDKASINLNVDGETFYMSCPVPSDWDAASDITIYFLVGNEIAEDDGDDVSIDAEVAGWATGEAASGNGQSVPMVKNLTGGLEAINYVNYVKGTIDYNEAMYPLAMGDTIVMKFVVNLGGVGECTGPLHVVGAWLSYLAAGIGTAAAP